MKTIRQRVPSIKENASNMHSSIPKARKHLRNINKITVSTTSTLDIINYIYKKKYRPSAFQVWSLTHAPSVPHIFPTTSMFANLDHLFWRAHSMSDYRKIFSWILWFIWKARNTKIFENKDTHPAETLSLAKREAEDYRIATAREAAIEATLSDPIAGLSASHSESVICQIDGSWDRSDPLSGHGWLALSNNKVILLGLKCDRRCQSPLHSELLSLI